jgi:hypothetical protein
MNAVGMNLYSCSVVPFRCCGVVVPLVVPLFSSVVVALLFCWSCRCSVLLLWRCCSVGRAVVPSRCCGVVVPLVVPLFRPVVVVLLFHCCGVLPFRCCGVVVPLVVPLFRGCGVVGGVVLLTFLFRVIFASGILAVLFIECFQGLDHDWIMIETRTMATEGF